MKATIRTPTECCNDQPQTVVWCWVSIWKQGKSSDKTKLQQSRLGWRLSFDQLQCTDAVAPGANDAKLTQL